MMKTTVSLAAFLIVVSATIASAQTPRVSIAAGASVQPTTNSFTDATAFPYLQETARLEGDYDVGDGVAFDVGATIRFWRRLGVGVGVTSVTRSSSAETIGTFPHPFFLNTNRTLTVSEANLDRKETGVHLSVAFDVLQSDRLGINLFAGPSYFLFDQAVVESLDPIETYPYDALEARVQTGSADGNALGFHAGFDAGWFFTRNVGVGGMLRFTQATKSGFRIGDGDPFDLKIGGFQGGGGLRIRF
jgi:hypothetical protein